MITCRHCGMSNDSASRVCPQCGTALPSNSINPDGAARRRKRQVFLNATIVAAALVVIAFCGGLLFQHIHTLREAARLSESKVKLRMLGLAMLNYHDVYLKLPPGAVVGPDRTRHHSWMSSILPQADNAHLYLQIDFNRPWDDPVNIPYFRTEIQEYLNPSVSTKFDATGLALSHYAGNSNVFGDNSSTELSQIRDGLAQTILVGEEAGNYRAWGFPGNWRDPAKGINTGPDSFGRPTGDGAIFLFADGRTQFLSNKTDPKILRALSTPDGGEQVPPDVVPAEQRNP
jgi:hypothetical protein